MKSSFRKILAISASLRPYSIGGAEISHELCMNELSKYYQVTIATFYPRPIPKREKRNNLEIIWLPIKCLKGYSTGTSINIAMKFLFSSPTRNPADFIRQVKDTHYDSLQGNASKDFINMPNHYIVQLLQEVIKEVRPDVLLADNYRAICYTALAAKDLDIPSSAIVRDNRFLCNLDNNQAHIEGAQCHKCSFDCLDKPLPLKLLMHRSSRDFRLDCLSCFNSILCTSNYLSNQISTLMPGAAVYTIGNPSDSPAFVDHIIETTPESPGHNILIAGMINNNKGQIKFLESLLKTNIPLNDELVIHLAGRSSQDDQIKLDSLCKKLGKKRVRVVQHGYLDRERLYSLIRSCQLCLSTAIWPEPFGRAPLEAGLAAKPIVSFEVGGLTESIINNKTGILVENRNYDLLLSAICALLNDSELRYVMGQNNRSYILSKYSLSLHCQKVSDSLLKTTKDHKKILHK